MVIEQHHLETINQCKISHFKIYNLKNHHVEEFEGNDNLKVKKPPTKQNQSTAIKLKEKNHYLSYSSYLSFTINLSWSSVSISSDSSFTVLIIPFSLFSSFRNSYRPCSKAALQACLSVTWSKHTNLRFLKNQRTQTFSTHYCLHLI